MQHLIAQLLWHSVKRSNESTVGLRCANARVTWKNRRWVVANSNFSVWSLNTGSEAWERGTGCVSGTSRPGIQLRSEPQQARTIKHDDMLSTFSRRLFNTRSQVSQCTRSLSVSAIRRADPWPLPHSPQHIAATQTPKDEARIPPIPRPNESEESMRARLVYQSRKRGTLETDLLLSTFARDYLSTMSVAEMQEYDKVRCTRYYR